MTLPRITVVTPSLNSAPMIERTLQSVREQAYPDVEHLVIDGGSTDGTLEILERAGGIRFVSEPDKGLSDAVNKGIGMATGDVIGWLNADDLYLPGALRKVAAAFAANPDREWVTGLCPIIDADDREIRRFVTWYKRSFLRRYSFPLYLVQNFVCTPATFVRAKAFAEVGLFDKHYRYSMDYELFLRLGRRGPPVVIDDALACFRMVEGTLSMNNFRDQFVEHAKVARRHGQGHFPAVVANAVVSRLIVAVYRILELRRRRR
jgi:glycosyltransferase involved in cell wall biosynthesis